jgi:hypothetical protein
MIKSMIAALVCLRAARISIFTTICSLVAMLIFINGCAQLKVNQYHGGMVEGIPYALPKKSFLIAVDYEVKECSVKSGKLFLDIKKTAAVTEIVEQGEQFYIPYKSIRNGFKDTDIVVQSYNNSTLKSVSMEVVDKSGPAIVAITGGVLRVLKLSASPPSLVAKGADQKLRNIYCSQGVVGALDEIENLKKAKVKADANALKIENLKGLLRFKQVVKWMPMKDSNPADKSQIGKVIYPGNLLSKQVWLTAAGLDALSRDYRQNAVDQTYPIEPLITHVTIALARPIVTDPTLADELPGLVIRKPNQGLLTVCDGYCPAQESDEVDGIVGTSDVTIPQLGDYVILPLKNRIFQEQKVELALSESGEIQKIGVTSKASSTAAAESFNTNFDQIKTFHDERENAKNDARTAAANQTSTVASNTAKLNQTLTNCFAAQKALKDAGGVPVGTCQ